ncbi:hypothetical protein ABKV19_014502 [Rosa sericea]
MDGVSEVSDHYAWLDFLTSDVPGTKGIKFTKESLALRRYSSMDAFGAKKEVIAFVVVHIVFQDGLLLIHEQERGLAKSTIIAGYSQAGYVEEAFEYFSWMRMDVANPNEYDFTRVSSVCGTMAMLAQGKQLHAHVLTVALDCEAMVQSALVNLHLKCGSLQEAAKIFDVIKVADHLFDFYIIFIEPLIACYLRYMDKQPSHGRYEDSHATVSSTIMNEEKYMFVTIDKLCTALVFKCCPIGIVEVPEKWFLDVMNMNLETMVGKIKCGGEKELHVNLLKIHREPLGKCLGYALPTLDAICLCGQKLFLVDWAFANVSISWKDVETKLFTLNVVTEILRWIGEGMVSSDFPLVLPSAILHRRVAMYGAAATTIFMKHLYWNWLHFFAGVPVDIHLNHDWKESFPDDPTGRFGQFKALVRGVQILTQNVKLEDKFLLRGLYCYENRLK